MDDEQSDEQDFFAVTSSLADDYSATEEGIADAYREFTAGDDSPTGVYATMQHTVILNIAVVHQQECGGGCGTCDQIRLGLENAVAALRMNMDADLRGRLRRFRQVSCFSCDAGLLLSSPADEECRIGGEGHPSSSERPCRLENGCLRAVFTRI
jgi:hypothetical protein